MANHGHTHNSSMNIVFRDPALLIPHPQNPKDHPPEQIAAIADSIKNFGFDQPIVIREDGTIIKGHGRRLAAISIGMKSVPVLISTAAEAEATLNSILDNHLVSQDYDQFVLRDELLNLQGLGALDLTGISEDQIPDLYKVASRVETQMFSLATRHKCPKCSYRW